MSVVVPRQARCPQDRAQTSRPPSQRSAAPTSSHCPSRQGSPDQDDLPDDHVTDQPHHLLATVKSQLDKRTRRSEIAADRSQSRRTSPLRRLSSSPSVLVLSPTPPPTTPPSFILPCVRRICPTVINHRPPRGCITSRDKHNYAGALVGCLESSSVIPRWC